MATYDWTGTDVIPNGSGSAVRADLNDALLALFSQNSGNDAPTTSVGYMLWADPDDGYLKIRHGSNSGIWYKLFKLNGVWDPLLLVNGTAGTPSLQFSSSGTDTGLYSPGADQVAITTAGVQRVNFNGATEVVFNDVSADVDFRIEGNNEPNLFKIDAGNDWVQVKNLNGGPLAGFRNRIINGNFDIWQRGTSFTANDYGADRWVHNRVGTTHTASRQAFTLGQTDVPGEPEYFCRTIVSSVAGAGNFAALLQKIEGVRTFAGQQVTISFWAKADASKPIAVELYQSFGTGGSPSAAVQAIGVTKSALSTSWQKITVTATVPSISGKTIGTAGDDYLTLVIWFDAGSTYNARTDSLGQQSGTFDIAQVQIEPGTVATPFERRNYGLELALCQRYFERLNGRYVSSAKTGISDYVSWTFKVEKRTIPTIVYANSAYGTQDALAVDVTTVLSSTTAAAVIGAGSTASAEL